MNEKLNNQISLLNFIDKNSYDAVIYWLSTLEPYTNETLSAEDKDMIVSAITKLRDRIEENTENLRTSEMRVILTNQIERINNNQGINIDELNGHKSKFIDVTKDRVVERLNALVDVLPSDKLDIVETISLLEEERNTLGRSLANPSEKYQVNPEIEALIAQIEIKEVEINGLEADQTSETDNLTSFIEFKRMSDGILEKYEEARKIENNLKLEGAVESLEKVQAEAESLVEKRKELLKTISDDKKVSDILKQIEEAESRYLKNKDIQFRIKIASEIKGYMKEMDLALGVTYDEKKIEELLTKLDDLNKRNDEYVTNKYDNSLSEEERKKYATLREEVSTERDTLIESITNDEITLELLRNIDNHEETMGVNKEDGLEDSNYNEYHSDIGDINFEKSNLRELVEKILREKYVAIAGSNKADNSNKEALEEAKKELNELNKRLDGAEKNIKVSTTSDDQIRFNELDKKIESLKVLKNNGVTSTQSYVSKLIKDFSNNLISEQELNSNLIELRTNASYLYGMNEKERTQELEKISKQKEKILSEIELLEKKISDPKNYDIYNNPKLSQDDKSQNTSYKMKELSEQIERLKANAANGNLSEIQKYQAEIDKLRIWAIDGNQSEIQRLEKKIDEVTLRKQDNLNNTQTGEVSTEELEIQRIRVQIDELREGARDRNQTQIQKLEEKMSTLRELAKDENQSEIQRLEKELDEERKNNSYKINTDYFNPQMYNYDYFAANQKYNHYRNQISDLELRIRLENGKIAENDEIINKAHRQLKLEQNSLEFNKNKQAELNKKIDSINKSVLTTEEETEKVKLEAELIELISEIEKSPKETSRLTILISNKEAENKEIEKRKSELNKKIERYSALKESVDNKIHDENKKSIWHSKLDELKLFKLKSEFEALNNRQKYLSSGKDIDAIIELTGGDKKKAEINNKPEIDKNTEEEARIVAEKAEKERIEREAVEAKAKEEAEVKEEENKKTTSQQAQEISSARNTKDEVKKVFSGKFSKDYPKLARFLLGTALILAGGIAGLVAIFIIKFDEVIPDKKPAVTATMTPESPQKTAEPSTKPVEPTITPAPIVKSNDTSLEYLKINGHSQDLTKPFDATVESGKVSIEAKAKDSKATVVGNSTYAVESGKNYKFKIIVTAEDGTVKESEIIIRVRVKQATATPAPSANPTPTPVPSTRPGNGGGGGSTQPTNPPITPTDPPVTPTTPPIDEGKHIAENKPVDVVNPETGETRKEALPTSLQNSDYIARLYGDKYIITRVNENTLLDSFDANEDSTINNSKFLESVDKLNNEHSSGKTM